MSGNSRKDLVATADRLGIPWTLDTSDEQLAALIDARQKGSVNMGTAEHSNPPQCHGILWEAVGQSSCVQCSAKDTCLVKFKETTFKNAQLELGPKATPEQLAEKIEVSLEAVLYVLTTGPVKEAKKKTTLKVVENLPEEAPVAKKTTAKEVAQKITDAVLAPPPPVPMQAATTPPPPSAVGGDDMEFDEDAGEEETPAAPPAPVEVKEEQDVKTKPTKAAKEKAPPKAAKPAKAPKGKVEVKAEAPVPPQQAGTPASPAAAPAKKARAVRARPAKGPAVDRRVLDPWGKHTFQNRFQRDMDRLGLSPGQVLKTTHKKAEYQCKVASGHYLYDGRQFPTLYAVTKEVVGTESRDKQLVEGKRPEGTREICNYSAGKFWGLTKPKASPRPAKSKQTSSPAKPSAKKSKKSPKTKKKTVTTQKKIQKAASSRLKK